MGLHEQWAETLMGLLVLVLAVGVLVFSLTVGGVGGKPGGYDVTAKFGQVGSLAPGAAVTLAGVEVGTVSAIRLDPKTYLAATTLSLDPDVKLPSDSTARITSDSLLGGVHVAITPGGATDDIKPGGEIENTKGPVGLFGLFGSAMRPQDGGGGGGAAAPTAGEAPAASADTAPDNH
jgi:phospholipid/cholesterol/gamma-HCH transport system substrate-binding protein